MRRLFSIRADPGLATVLLIVVIAAWPLLTRPSLPPNEDGNSHIYRTQQILWAWQDGVSYVRWAPDFFFGFGYPLFNYYAPLTYYLGAAYGAALGAVAGVKCVAIVAIGLGALGMYLFTRELWGPLAGVVSAAAFALAPYNVYLNPVARTATPEMWAVALGPLLLWAFARLRRTGARRDVALAAFTLAALCLAHNLLSSVFIGILLVWLGWDTLADVVARRISPNWIRLGWIGLALTLGVGLAAFFWLPAALERGAVQFQRAFADAARASDQLQFITVTDLFGPANFADLAEPHVSGWKFRLGWPQWLLGLAGLLALFKRPRFQSTIIYFALLASGLILLTAHTPLTLTLWQTFPALTYLQLPWRLLGPTAAALGVLAGAATHWVSKPAGQMAVVIGAVGACIVGAFPLLDPLPWSDFDLLTPQRLFEYERAGNLGTTAQNEFLPASVTVLPEPQESLLWSYATGPIDKVNRAALPVGVEVAVAAHGPRSDSFHVTAPADLDLTLFTFAFPGWTAYVDGTQTLITASQPQGWIVVHIPSGAHTVMVRFEDTPPRQWGWLVSGLALLGLMGLAMWPAKSPSTVSETSALPWRAAAWVGVVVLVGLGLRALADRASPWQTDLPDYAVPNAEHQFFIPLDDNVALLAYDLPQTTVHPSDTFPLTVYWKATGPVSQDLSVFVHLLGADGQLWGQSDKVRPVPYFPTSRWPLNRYFRDEHQVAVRADAPSGLYALNVGLWNRATGVRLNVLTAGGQLAGPNSITLTTEFVVSNQP
jgi:hypothetical protein